MNDALRSERRASGASFRTQLGGIVPNAGPSFGTQGIVQGEKKEGVGWD